MDIIFDISVIIDYFLKDFDIDDLDREPLIRLFNPDKFDYIKNECNKYAQIFHLMWVLEEMSDSDIKKFLDIIRNDYEWIVQKIEYEINFRSNDTLQYIKTSTSMKNDNSKHTLYNVHRTEQFLNLRTALRSLNFAKGHNSVVLLGGLSSGKKWLARDVCLDFGTLKSMNFKIIWIDCTKCTDQLEDYNCLKLILMDLNPRFKTDNVGFTNDNFNRLKKLIKNELKSKGNTEALLVLANVQNTKCLDALNFDCKRLIITRNRKVSDSLPDSLNTHLILNKGLTLKEFYLLLDKYKNKNSNYDWRNDNLHLANDIYDMSLGEPSSLRIIAKHLSKKKSNWQIVMDDINNFEISDEKLQNEIAKSLKILNTNELQLFATFAIFPRCAQVPVKLLAYLWNLQLCDAEDFIQKLDNYFFVQKRLLEDNETIVCCVKFMYSSYINNCPEIQQRIKQKDLHKKIVNYYQVEDHLNSRKDVDFSVDIYDDYFYRWIGYHLYHADYKDLLAKIYTDFGFLDQKMKALDINNVIADINNYKLEIANGDRKIPLKKFNNFLAKSEEKITLYKDCCLLQYALFSSEDFIRELALKQIEKFPQRLWFTERGQYQQWRFIFKLYKPAELIRILDEDLCLVVLVDHKIYLIDLQLGTSCSQIQLMNVSYIEDMEIFDDKNHVLTLDKYGQMKLWYIGEEKRRIFNKRKLQSHLSYKDNRLYHKQSINEFLSPFQKIQTFYLKSRSQDSSYSLFVTLSNGLLKSFDWNDKTKRFHDTQFSYPLRIRNIHHISIIRNTHCMIIYYTENNKLDIVFIKLRNTQEEYLKLTFPDNEDLLYHTFYDKFILLVFQHVVIQVHLTFDGREENLNGYQENLYETPHCAINCAKLLLDNKYLMLGTQRGIKVFDLVERIEILQSIVSENVNSIDVSDLDDDVFKSIIVCSCSNKNILYIFSLRLANDQTLVWEHSTSHKTTKDLKSSKEIHTSFIGDRLFAVCETNDNLYAIDLKNRIHQISLNDSNIREILPSLHENSHIVGINCFGNTLIVAYDNGHIYDYFDKRLLVNIEKKISTDLFLKAVDNNILVISWLPDDYTYIKHLTSDHSTIKIQTQTKYCKMIMDTHLLVVNTFGAAVIYDCESNFINPNYRVVIKPSNTLASCDLKNNMLFLGFSSYAVHIYSLEKQEDDSIDYVKVSEIATAKEAYITCLTANHKADLLAVAINTTNDNGERIPGDIEIFKLNHDYKPQLIFILKSHIKTINDLHFSPQSEVLVSVGERICFWNITYILNNPLDLGNKKRHSSRFTSQKSTEEVDYKRKCQQQRRQNLLNPTKEHFTSLEFESKVEKNTNISFEQSISSDNYLDDSVFDNSIEDTNNWCGLTGSIKKPELLSCLKLDGNEAKQILAHKNFTQFSTIDNEGVYYNLQRLQVTLPEENNSDDIDITDSSASSIILDNNNDTNHRLSIDSSITSGADVVDDANT